MTEGSSLGSVLEPAPPHGGAGVEGSAHTTSATQTAAQTLPIAGTAPVSLAVSDLRKSFDRGKVQVLHGINLTVHHGESVAIIGSNGCGKSTLLRCCLRLIEPDAGTVDIAGDTITAARGRRLRRLRSRVGFIFQRHHLVPQLSALTNVLHGVLARRSGPRCWNQALARREDREEAFACLEQVGLADIADRHVAHLSGGQSQRVAVARALMQRPQLLFADEPAASLDPQAGEEIMALFARLVGERGLTLVVVSHHLDHALGYAQRVVGMRHGHIEVDAAANSLSASELRGLYGA